MDTEKNHTATATEDCNKQPLPTETSTENQQSASSKENTTSRNHLFAAAANAIKKELHTDNVQNTSLDKQPLQKPEEKTPETSIFKDPETVVKKRLRLGDAEPMIDPFSPSQRFLALKQYRRRSIFRKYNFLPLIAVGLVGCALFIIIFGFIWGIITFFGQYNITNATFIPACIYLGGIAFAAAIMTMLIKGGTVFPAAILAILVCGLTLLLAGKGFMSFWGICNKLLLSLIFAMLGFTAAKLYINYRKNLPDKMADSLTFRDYD